MPSFRFSYRLLSTIFRIFLLFLWVWFISRPILNLKFWNCCSLVRFKEAESFKKHVYFTLRFIIKFDYRMHTNLGVVCSNIANLCQGQRLDECREVEIDVFLQACLAKSLDVQLWPLAATGECERSKGSFRYQMTKRVNQVHCHIEGKMLEMIKRD